MLYAFELSGEHKEIPAAEIYGALESRGFSCQTKETMTQCILVDIERPGTDVSETDRILREDLSEALSMTHAISRVIDVCGVGEDEILDMADHFNAKEWLTEGQKFVVRAKRLGNNSVLKSMDIEGRVGGRIFRQGFRAGLKDADVVFRLTLSDRAVFGLLIAHVDRGSYECRSPQQKPFFYPGVLMPRMARALCNMAGVRPGVTMLDPFCGTAGILLEAGLLGAEVIGVDAQEKIVVGAVLNMEGYDAVTGAFRKPGDPAVDYTLLIGDACRLPFADETVDAVITDPPYGRSAAIKAESLEALYAGSFREICRVLRPGSKAVIVSEIDVLPFAGNAGFTVTAVYKQRVHRSLTRTITLVKKE